MSKPVLLLIPGKMCDARLFGPQIAYFGDSYDVRIAPTTGHRSIAGMAGAAIDMLEGSSAIVAGLSMGGIVAFEMFRQAPGVIERLVLLDTNYKADGEQRRPVRERQIAEAEAGRMLEVFDTELMPAYLAKQNQGDQLIRTTLRAMAGDLGPSTFTDQSVALRERQGYGDMLPMVEVPVLVACGVEDRVCPQHLHEDMAARLPRAQLQIVPGAGHISTLEQPDVINEIIARFLD